MYLDACCQSSFFVFLRGVPMQSFVEEIEENLKSNFYFTDLLLLQYNVI